MLSELDINTHTKYFVTYIYILLFYKVVGISSDSWIPSVSKGHFHLDDGEWIEKKK